MKRVGNVMERICDFENMHEAFLRAARGKTGKMEVRKFRQSLEERLQDIRQRLYDGSFEFGKYHFFSIYDPKPRMICAASFDERVAFHAMMRICHPVFDNYQIYDSYASRIGKGTYKALERSVAFCRKYKWFLKLDVCKYFDSIDHDVLFGHLCRLFKDKTLLYLFHNLIDSYGKKEGKGLPIGNLTSQYFANHYLALADHYSKENLKVRAMVRYMDDVLFFSDEKEDLLSAKKKYENYLFERLKLTLHEPVVNSTKRGVPFLGYVVRPSGLRMSTASRHRFRNRQKMLDRLWLLGNISDDKYRQQMQSMYSFIDHADAMHFIKRIIQEQGSFP